MINAYFYFYDEWLDWLEGVLNSMVEIGIDVDGVKEELMRLAKEKLFRDVDSIIIGDIESRNILSGYIFSNIGEFVEWCWAEYGKDYWEELVKEK